MKLSVITPTFNNGPELTRALQSVFLQPEIQSGDITLELILVNDGSSSEYLEKLEAVQVAFGDRLKLIHLPMNCGPAGARNEGIKASTGDWIGFVDADDEWPSDKLSLVINYLKQNNYDVVGGKVKYFSKSPEGLPSLPFDEEENRIYHVHLGALLVRKSLFLEELWFDETLRIGEDTDWWIRIRENKKSIWLVPEVTLHYYVHNKSITATEGNQNREMLDLIRKSLQRRRNESKTVQPIPTLKSFSKDSDQVEAVIFCWKTTENHSTAALNISSTNHVVKVVGGLNEALQQSKKYTSSDYFIYTSAPEAIELAKLLQELLEDPYLYWISQNNELGDCQCMIIQSKVMIQEKLEKQACEDLNDLQQLMTNLGYKGRSI